MKTIEEAKKELLELGLKQSQRLCGGTLCPRCGKNYMDKDPVRNALSRQIDVYVCDVCGIDEALMDANHKQPLPFNQWSIFTQDNQNS